MHYLVINLKYLSLQSDWRMKLCGFLFALFWKYLFAFSLTFFKITTQFGSQWSVSY